MTTVDEARVEAARKAYYEREPISWSSLVAYVPHVADEARECMSRALAAADAVRGDQQGAGITENDRAEARSALERMKERQPESVEEWADRIAGDFTIGGIADDQLTSGAPSGPGWSAEPEPVPVSAAGGDHPSRDYAGLVSFAKQVLHASWDLADIDGSDIQEWAARYGLLRPEPYDPEKHGPNDYDAEPGDAWFVYAGPLAPAIEARSAETQGGSAAGESAAGEAGAPQVEALSCSSEVARRVAQIARERDTFREDVERLREALKALADAAVEIVDYDAARQSGLSHIRLVLDLSAAEMRAHAVLTQGE